MASAKWSSPTVCWAPTNSQRGFAGSSAVRITSTYPFPGRSPDRALVIVDDPDYCRAGAAFDARNFPHVSCRGETVQHREVERRPIGSAFGTAIAEHRWGLAGDLHGAVRLEPMLAPGDGPSSARLRAQGDFEVLANSHQGPPQGH